MSNGGRAAGFAAVGALVGAGILCAIPGGAVIGGPMAATAAGTLMGATAGAAAGAAAASATEPKKQKRSRSTVNKAKQAQKKQRVDRDYQDLKAARQHEEAVRVLLAFAIGATDGQPGRVEKYVLGLRGQASVTPKLRKVLAKMRKQPPSFQACMGLLRSNGDIPDLAGHVQVVLQATGNAEWLGWYMAEVA